MRTSRPIAIVTVMAALGAAFFLSGSACSPFGAVVEPGDAGVAPDAGAGGPPDSAVPNDAASASPDGGPPPVAFCAAHAGDPGLIFCADFEPPEPTSDPFGFTDSAIAPTVTGVSVVPDADSGHGGALEVFVSSENPTGHDASVRRILGSSAMGPLPLQLELDVKIVKNTAEYATLAALHFSGAGCEASFGIGVFGGASIGGTRNASMMMPNYPVGEWRHVTTRVTPSTASTTGYREQTTYGGAVLVDRDATPSTGAATARGCTLDELVIGVYECSSSPAQVTVRYDNVLVRSVVP